MLSYYKRITYLEIIMASSEIASLVQEISSSAQTLLQQGNRGQAISSVDEKARQSLIQAAEKLVIASRRPDENLYATATNV